MENGETVIGMLHHVIIGLRYWSRECAPSWTSAMRRNIQRWRRNIGGNIGQSRASPNILSFYNHSWVAHINSSPHSFPFLWKPHMTHSTLLLLISHHLHIFASPHHAQIVHALYNPFYCCIVGCFLVLTLCFIVCTFDISPLISFCLFDPVTPHTLCFTSLLVPIDFP